MKLSKDQAIKLAKLVYGQESKRVKEIEQVYKQLQTDTIDTINSYINDGKDWNAKAPLDDIKQLLEDVKNLYDDLNDDEQNLVRIAFSDNKLKSNGDMLLAKVTGLILGVAIYQRRQLIGGTADISKAYEAKSYQSAKKIIKKTPKLSGKTQGRRFSSNVDVIMQKMARNAVLDRHIDTDIISSINKQTLQTIRKVRDIAERAAKSNKDSLNWQNEVANVLTGGNRLTNGQMGRAAGMIRTATAQSINRTTLEGLKKRKVKRYKFVSLEAPTTCADCHNLDGKIFNVADAEEGVNYPLIHINCQCIVTEVNEDDDWDTSDHDITEEFKKL